MTFKGSISRGIVDTHLHVWSDGAPPFPYSDGQDPPEALRDSQPEQLMGEMAAAGVDGALIVQPINHKFDHAFVTSIISDPRYQGKFKGMALLDPTADNDYLPSLKAQGYVGVRFNPYLFNDDLPMRGARGMELFKQCGDLGMPVGFMCFKGLNLHILDIKALMRAHPTTSVVIDHWGFFLQDGCVVEESWRTLLDTAATYPNLYIKVSAPFRNSKEGWPYDDLRARLAELIAAVGAHRVMAGSDYPFVRQPENCGYEHAFEGPLWTEVLTTEERNMVMRGTAESLFGEWPSPDAPSSSP
jgi:predicted TIM-barrel fold metal-dependent hydrolase